MRSVICLSAFIQQVATVKGGHTAAPFFSLKKKGVGYLWVHSLSNNETREKAWGNNERDCWWHQPHLVFVCLGFQEMTLSLPEQLTPVYLLRIQSEMLMSGFLNERMPSALRPVSFHVISISKHHCKILL